MPGDARPGAAKAESPKHDALVYVANWVALMALGFVSYGLSFTHLGSFSQPVAFGIAAVKAVLVLVFFMHVMRAPVSSRLLISVALGLLFLLVLFMTADVLTRRATELSPPLGTPTSHSSEDHR